jgi:hypothetical protein
MMIDQCIFVELSSIIEESGEWSKEITLAGICAPPLSRFSSGTEGGAKPNLIALELRMCAPILRLERSRFWGWNERSKRYDNETM